MCCIHLPTEKVSTLTMVSAKPAKEAARIIPTIYTFREASSMLNVLNVQVLDISSFAVGAVTKVPVGAVIIMLVTDPASVAATEAVHPDSSKFEEKLIKLLLLPVEEESG